VRTGLAALAASALIAAGLAWQMASGGDPALGAGAQSGEQDKRRVVQTTVIRRVGDPTAPATGSSSGSASPSAPVISAPAPVTSSTS